MNWEAFFAVGVVVVILGALLCILVLGPAHFLVKRTLHKHPELAKGNRITKAGIAYYSLVVGFLVFWSGAAVTLGVSHDAFIGVLMIGTVTFIAIAHYLEEIRGIKLFV